MISFTIYVVGEVYSVLSLTDSVHDNYGKLVEGNK